MHKKALLACAILSSFSTVGGAVSGPRHTDYCLIEKLEIDGDEADAFVMKARLQINGSHYVLDAWNVQWGNSQTLELHADGTYRQNGPTPIRFIDNFNNRGRGSFSATKSTLHIEIKRVKASPEGRNIGRNYGSFDLKADGCSWDWQ